jgi:tetratricopeptide (TPR) repeat protein
MPLASALAALETSGLIRALQGEADLEYLFRHVLVQDAAYESMLKADRKRLHLSVAEAIERAYPDQLAELAPALAGHFLAADDAARALKYFLLAGDFALKRYANGEAEAHYRAALLLVTVEAERARVLSQLGEALVGLSRFEEAIGIWREAIQLAQTLGDGVSVARLYARSARAAGTAYLNDIPRALALCREGLSGVAHQPESAALAALLHEAGRACYFSGLPAEARAYCEQALAMAERLNDVETQADAMATLWGLIHVSEPDTVIPHLQRAAQLAEAAGRLDIAARVYHNLGFLISLALGDMRGGQPWIERAVECFKRLGNVSGQFYSLQFALVSAYALGHFAELEAMLGTMRELLNVIPNTESDELVIRMWAIALQFVRGEWSDARDGFRAVLAAWYRFGKLDEAVEAAAWLGDVSLELNPADWGEAEAVLIEAVALEDRDVGRLEAHCLLSTVYARQGRWEAAHQLLAKAQAKNAAQPLATNAQVLAEAQARLAVAEGRWPDALTAFETTAALRAGQGLRWYRARTLHEWAEAHLSRNESGDVDRARELLREAQAEFEAMNAPKYAALVQDSITRITGMNG